MSILTLLFALFLGMPAAFADDTNSNAVTLDPVVSEGTPADSLKFDPAIPAYTGKTKTATSTGNIAKDLTDDLPFNFDSNFKPGNEVGVIGIGKGPEETDVNILGIPINRPQGGGADLATFPQYFWSGYSYQLGPSLGAFDPRGVGGSLSLHLWTQDNLGTEGNRATAFESGRHLQQFSYGHASKDYAILAGMTTDLVTGPALSFSAIPYEDGRTKITTHLIYSQTDAKDFASERSGSLTGNQKTYRLIPVVQVDEKFAASIFKTSFFYDGSYVDYEDTSDPTAKQIKKINQVGNESAWIMGTTRLGFGLRSVSYSRTAQTSDGVYPSEQVLNLQASHGFNFATGANSNLFVEPSLGGYAVTRKGFFPTASLGARNETKFGDSAKFGEFARISFTKRFPSLLDRYYQINQAVDANTTLVAIPNPDLKPEDVRSVETGVDFANGAYKNQITFFARDYKHARYTRSFLIQPFPTIIGFQMVNAGNAWVVGATQSQDLRVNAMLDLGTRLTYQRSQIEDLNAEFPYSPDWVGIIKADIHDPNNRYGLEIVNKAATKFLSYGETEAGATQLPAYYYLDLFLRAEVRPGLTLVGGVENVFGKIIQYRITDPDEGRVYSIAANAVF